MDIKEYFSRMQNGDREAFTHIYSELKKPVFTVACRIVQSREAAEDITHDVFLKLYTSPPDSSVKNVRAWVFAMTRNLSLDALKKKTHEDIETLTLAAADELCGVAERLDVERAVASLPLCEREILSLHLAGGLGFFEIARIVGLSMPAVYRRYRKALASVRDSLGAYYGGAL